MKRIDITNNTKNLAKEMKKLKEQGFNYTKIANILNVSTSRVSYWLGDDEYREQVNIKVKERYYKTKNNIRCRAQRALLKSRHPTTKKDNYIPCTAEIKEITEGYTGFCHICNIKEDECNSRLNMDHCHKTGKFRGWLCSNCNLTLGRMNDSIENLNKLIKYLEKNK